MNTHTKSNLGDITKNVGRAVGIALLLGTASACDMLHLPARYSGDQNAKTYETQGIPLVSSVNSPGNDSTLCDISIVVQDENGQKQGYGGMLDCLSINNLNAMLQAEINDGDQEQIKLIVYRGDANFKDGVIKSVDVEGKSYNFPTY